MWRIKRGRWTVAIYPSPIAITSAESDYGDDLSFDYGVDINWRWRPRGIRWPDDRWPRLSTLLTTWHLGPLTIYRSAKQTVHAEVDPPPLHQNCRCYMPGVYARTAAQDDVWKAAREDGTHAGR